jgi:hypothetical protein
MARHLFAILDDLTANLAELKATLAPLALIGGTVVSEVGRAVVAPASREETFTRPRTRSNPTDPKG